MKNPVFFLALILTIPTQAQVIDVNGDHIVGPEEAIAVAERWKGPASASNEHDHLSQTWEGDGRPLTMKGNFSERFVDGTSLVTRDAAPLRLDNTRTKEAPDLELGGLVGVIYANGNSPYRDGDLVLKGNRDVHLVINANGSDPGAALLRVTRANEIGALLTLVESGDAFLRGSLSSSSSKTQIDHPLDPTRKWLIHSSVESPEMKTAYDGVVILDHNGEAVVQLPEYMEALNTDFRYQLTPIGASAPNLHVAEEVQDNRFKIAGGPPTLRVSWQVTGVRQDAYAKANPIEVEQEKPDEDKGKSFRSPLMGNPPEISAELIDGLGDR